LIEDGGWLYPELSDIRRIMAEWGLSEFQDARKADSACARPRQIFGGHAPYTQGPGVVAVCPV